MKRIGLLLTALALVGAARAGAGLEGGRPDFTPTVAEEEGYWYSRYNLGNLVMRSGLGLPFAPPKAAVQKMIRAVDANPADGDTVRIPPGITLLAAVYKGGDPHYVTKVVPKDFATQRWDPATFDKTVTARAMGWTMMKELEWAKQFHVDSHFGTPKDDFGAQWRFVGMVMAASAKRQGAYLAAHLNEAGLFPDSDGRLDWTGQWVGLEALANLTGLLAAEKMPHSAQNRYRDPAAAKKFQAATERLYKALTWRVPSGAVEEAQAVQALVWVAANLPELREDAEARLRKWALLLASAPARTPGEKAYKLRGLIEAYRVSDDPFFKRLAARTFRDLAAGYNFTHGMFKGAMSHTIDDVAAIMGAINASRLFLGEAIDQDLATRFFTNFFESAVNLSGLQQSVPPIPVAKGKFEQDENPLFYGYPSIPKPPMAGGRFGIAPVFASRIAWDAEAKRFKVKDRRFDSAGAMHAANAFIWFHNDEVNGFPELP